VIIFSGVFSVLFTKKALADNYYIDKIIFFNDNLNNGRATLQFHVKTSFNVSTGVHWQYVQVCEPTLITLDDNSNYSLDLWYIKKNGVRVFPVIPSDMDTCASLTLEAGYTYEVPLAYAKQPNYNFYGYYNGYYQYYYSDFVYGLTTSDYITNIFQNTNAVDNGIYYLTQFPSLSISYPHANDEITGAFYVDGSYSVPSLTDYSRLLVWFTTPDNNTYPNAYYDLPATTGNFHILISNLPAGYYYLNFVFTGNKTYFYPNKIYIHIVNDIPEILSTGETTPSTPAFGYTAPDIYYVSHSNYSTSTALFNELSNSIGALIQSIGNSLSSFAGKFTLTDAQKTATMLAGSVSTIRTYGNNLNSFFGSLPVSEILFLYLIIFIAVIVFRLIKNLVNLIKP
jgi:hypothetical protein